MQSSKNFKDAGCQNAGVSLSSTEIDEIQEDGSSDPAQAGRAVGSGVGMWATSLVLDGDGRGVYLA